MPSAGLNDGGCPAEGMILNMKLKALHSADRITKHQSESELRYVSWSFCGLGLAYYT